MKTSTKEKGNNLESLFIAIIVIYLVSQLVFIVSLRFVLKDIYSEIRFLDRRVSNIELQNLEE